MNGINNNVSVNTALLQGISEQINETSTTEKKEGLKEVASNKPSLSALGQNQVSANDMEGVKHQVSINDLASGTPTLTEPNEQAGKDASGGKNSKLFGEMSGAGKILELMLATIESGNQARQLQRQVSTTKQNISIQEGMNQVDKMMQSADKTRMGAITQGVVGALGTGVSLGGLAGMNSNLRTSINDKLGINAAKQTKLEGKIQSNLAKQGELVLKDFKGARTGGAGLNSQEKAKLNQLKAKAENLQNQLKALKDPTSANAKALQQAKSDNIKAAMELFSSNTTTVNNTVRQGLEADAATLNAKGQLDNIHAETAKTDRSKAEGNYENAKAAITSLMRVMADILQALNASSSAAARA